MYVKTIYLNVLFIRVCGFIALNYRSTGSINITTKINFY